MSIVSASVPQPPPGYSAEELDRDNPHNAWMHEADRLVAIIKQKPTVLKTLFDPSDAELEHAFGNDVAHWAPGRQDAEYVRVWEEVFGERLPDDCLRPRYCSSFDLVQPFLERWSKNRPGYVHFSFLRDDVWRVWCETDPWTRKEGQDKSLGRAGVIALLRAHGWALEFSKKP